MRIVAGTARGRRLIVPDGTTTRPTTDRVREAMFNSLYSLGVIEGARFADLFAGSGALGLEALSRGAAHCTFVERDRAALGALRENIETLDMADRSRVVAGDGLAAASSGPFDVVLADPPYDFDDWPRLLDLLAVEGTGIVVVESGHPIGPHPGWETGRQKAYGSTVVTILTAIDDPASLEHP